MVLLFAATSGPMRVWLQHADAPGLMVTRSLGDDLAHSVGVTAEPEVGLARSVGVTAEPEVDSARSKGVTQLSQRWA